MNAFDATAATTSLRGFQRATVAHVMDRYFGAERTRRFLVADETGLGKSLVARGVIAHTIERLLDDDAVSRVDVVYVCSSSDLAAQNLRRLDVVGDRSQRVTFADRLTLLAVDAHQLRMPARELAKPVNLISFTPGTSFDPGSRFGRADERALLLLLLRDQLHLEGWDWRGAQLVLQGFAGKSFPYAVEAMERRLEQVGGADPTIVRTFRRAARRTGLIRRFEHLVEGIGHRRSLTDAEQQLARSLVGDLRTVLAEAGVETLEPDLIILDEFQRFRHLLDPTSGPAAELAHQLFDHGDARVLLLSATPYKPFSLAEETTAGDDHFTDLLTTLRFLANGSSATVDTIAADLAAFRTAAITGAPVADIRDRLQDQLLQLMCRTERPQLGADGMLAEHANPADHLQPTDLLDYVALHRLAAEVDGALTVEYWKSAPYFANFMDGYQLATKVKDALNAGDPDRTHHVRQLLRATARLDRHAVEAFEPVDAANARLRRLVDDTIGAGWWQLLWLPPSLPYLQPGGPWADPDLASVTKRLLFSSWAATPSAAAALLSYEAERRIAEGSRYTEYTADARRRLATRLTYRTDGGRPAAMTTLALFWPHPTLAEATDPLEVARANPDTPIDSDTALQQTADRLADTLGGDGDARTSASEAWYWASLFGIPGALPADLELPAVVEALSGFTGETDETNGDGDDPDASEEPTRLDAHVRAAVHAMTRTSLGDVDRPADLSATVAAIGLHGPGNIAWRALHRLVHPDDTFDDAGLWTAAAVLSAGLRSLFSRHDTQLLLDRSSAPDDPYWRSVLAACAAGNLQAVLDEYLHHLRHNDFAGPLDNATLLRLAHTARRALALRPATYQATDPAHPGHNISFLGRFALRYGSRRGDTTAGEAKRLPEIRNAFNSPFWPFVLATTSVGQEGIDFHWWCHAVVHWNTPASPVDFEQREGRVHRYAGHGIRRNIAAAHRHAILNGPDTHPWDTAWAVATDRCDELGELAPHWIYPGPHKIERHIAPFPLSRDMARLANLKDDLALYRLAFGQPRQEDLLALLQRRGAHLDPAAIAELRIDLRPPLRTPPEPSVRS
jgi:hypothetical protein